MQQNRQSSESGIESIHSEESLGNPSNHSFIGWLTAATDIWGLYPPNHLATCICIYSDFSRRRMTMHGTFLLKAPHRTSPDGFRTCRATLYNNNHHRRRSQVRVCNVNWMTYGGKLWVTDGPKNLRKILFIDLVCGEANLFFYRVMICEQIWQKKTGIGMSTNGPALYGYSDKVLLCPEKLRHFKRLHYLFGLFAINSHRKWFCSLPIVSSENLFVFYLPKTIHCILVCLRKTNYCIDIALYKY